MSSFYEDASLVMIPSGYKTSKVYCAKPTDGAGDLTFTRSNDTATRVNSAGLIEKVRTNLVLQSVWPSIGTGVAPTSWVVGTGPATSFSAGPLAGQLLCNTSASRGFITQSVSLTAGEYALSVFVDSVTTTNAVADLVLIFGSTNRKYYEDGVQVDLNTNVVAGKRYAMVGTVTTGSFSMRIGSGVNANATANYVISRPQLEVSDFGATPYIATTTAAVSVGPVANVPRLDYLNSSCPRLLLEPQRQNVITFSEQMDNAAWTKTGGTISANVSATVDPSGYNGADKLVGSAGAADQVLVGQSISLGSAGTYTFSFFVKAAEKTWVRLRTLGFDAGGNQQTWFNLSTGAVGTDGFGNSKIVSYGNGWYRCIVSFATTTDLIGSVYAYLADSDNTTNVTRNGTDGLYLWGSMLELGAYATSYVNSLGAAVTRGADACSKTGISSLIGQTEGTIFLQFDNRLLTSYPNEYPLQIVGSGGHQLWLRKESASNTFTARLIVSSSTIWTFLNIPVPNGNTKIAISYKTGNSALYLNGTQFGSTSTAAFSGSAFADLYFNFSGTSNPELILNQALLFKTRLSNSDLAALTTL